MKKHSESEKRPKPVNSSSHSLRIEEQELVQALSDYDDSALSKAKVSWLFGQWQDLTAIEPENLATHPDRSHLALLVAAAHQQAGNQDAARKFTRFALDWGCPQRVVAKILIAGVHNTLGRIAALKQDATRIKRHFSKAVDVIAEGSQSDLISHARAVREMTRLGLLPQAAGFVDEEVKQLTASSRKPEVEKARVEVLRTEIDALQNKLILAQQRQQLFRPSYHQPEAEDHSQRVNNIKQKAVSQLGQDIWVLEKTNYKRNGFFVEFGATDGVLLSNTYLLEKEFGWNGICAEPNPKFHEQLRANRGCIVSQHCIAGKTGEQVEFILADAFGGMRRYADDDQHQEKREAYRLSGEVAIMTTISLDDFLKHYNAPREIDYLSIDTEGSEYEILASFPFDEWKIRLITVEHNFTDRRSDIRALLEKNGYRCTEMQWDDWYEIV